MTRFLLAAISAVLSLLSPEREVRTGPYYDAYGSHAAATNGDEYISLSSIGESIELQRYDRNGQPIATPLLLPGRSASAVASDGTDYVMAVVKFTGQVTDRTPRTFSLVYVSHDGTSVTETAFAHPLYNAALAWVQDHYLLVYQNEQAKTAVTALDRFGKPFGNTTILGDDMPPYSIASVHGTSILADQQGSMIHVRLLATDGTPTGASFSFEGTSPSVIWSGWTFLIAYSDANGSHVLDVNGLPFASVASRGPARIASDGNHVALFAGSTMTLFDRSGNPIREDALNQYLIAILSNGTTFMAFGSQTFVQTASDAPRPVVVRQTAEPESLPSMANGVMVWSEGRYPHLVAQVDGHDAVTIAEIGAPFPGFVASGKTNDLVIWQTGPVYGVRLAKDGTRLDTQPVLLIPGNSSGVNPAIAFDGTNYVISTVDVDGLRVHRFTEELLPLDPAGIPVSDPVMYIRHQSIASNGDRLLVTWDEVPPLIHRIAARVMTLNGEPATGILQLTSGLANDDAPVATTNGDNFLVTWSHGSNIAARTVSSDGALGATSVFGANAFWEKAAAWNGAHYLAYWVTASGLNAAVLDANGVLIEPPAAVTTIATPGVTAFGSTVAYVHASATQGDGGAQRLFTRTVSETPPRRRVAR